MNKRIALLLGMALLSVLCQAQPDTYLWPIEGAEKGQGILYKPQSYIDKELNYNDLVITAPLGTKVLCPTDGTITHISNSYQVSLEYGIIYGNDGNKSFDQSLEENRKSMKEKSKSYDPQYLSGSLGIRTSDGKMLYINGLSGSEVFKTGQKIKRGDPIGKVWYWYNKVKEPCIEISISEKNIASDPMTPFGLATTYKKPEEIKPITSLSCEKAKEDFNIFIDALRDAYPGLYDVVSEEELQAFITSTEKEIESQGENIEYILFRKIMTKALSKVHDSHLYLHPTIWAKNERPDYQPKIYLGWYNDTLICDRAIKEYAPLIGKEIVSVNGISADSAKKIVSDCVMAFDAKVQAYTDFQLATLNFGVLFSLPYGKGSYDMSVEFADGQKVDIKGASTKKGMPKFTTDWTPFLNINRYRNGYSHKMLNDSTAYLGIFTFQLNQTQEEEIAAFIDSVSVVPYLIIDVRNNSGGDAEVLNRMFSYLAKDTLTIHSYSRVNRKGGFKSFKNCLNYPYSEEPEKDLFPDYEAVEGKDGFYSTSDYYSVQKIAPDSTVNYPGKIYILTNENSISAATLLPAMIVRAHRGVVVGRETRTAYHFMNAMKFADIRLPNSLITITVPLVHSVFDDVVNDRVPYGRGVLPDYEVPLTLEEVEFKNGDAILNYTLKLIEDGRYLSAENPFAVTKTLKMPFFRTTTAIILISCGIALLLVLNIVLAVKRKRR